MGSLGLGRNKSTGKQVILNLRETINGNGIIFGASGAGKTHMIRSLSLFFAQNGYKSIIFDVHGDIYPNSPHVSTTDISMLSPTGLQPFKVNMDKEFGGVTRCIERFIDAINSTSNSSTKLGVRQVAVLTRLLEELFWKNGFYVKDPKTWSLHYDPWPNRKFPKKYPTFSDLMRFVKSKQKEVFLGVNTNVIHSLERFMSASSKLNSMRVRGEKSTGEYTEEEIDEMREDALSKYKSFLEAKNDDKLLDSLLTYTSSSVLASIYDRLENLEKTGLFKDREISFDPSLSMHRYDIHTLSKDSQRIFIQLQLSEIFLEAKQNGFGGKLNTLIFLDEAKNYITTHADDMVTKFYNEVRKFGYGMWLGGQRVEHFNDDIITNSATKMMLGIDQKFAKKFSSELQIPIQYIENIVPQSSMLASIKTKNDKGKFMEVNFDK